MPKKQMVVVMPKEEVIDYYVLHPLPLLAIYLSTKLIRRLFK